uniref:zinc finger protein 106 n=1 Tax=Centroberyx gerrardi TaxID=166262 RepID=UPI003AAB28E0
MHSMLHHRELEIVLGRDSFHQCQACKASSMGLNEYAQHISTSQHKAKLKRLKFKKAVKPISLFKSLSQETISRILERNKMLKKEEKKAGKKKKKRMKQVAGQKHAQTLQGMTRIKQEGSKPTKQKNSKQVKVRTPMQPEQTQQQGSSNTLVQNKENRVAGRLRSLHQRQSTTLQNQSGGLVCLSGEPPGRTWHHPHFQTQSSQSTHHLGYDNFSVTIDMSDFNNQCSEGRDRSSQTDRLVKREKNTQGGGPDTPDQSAWPNISQYEYYYGQYSGATDKDFTNDKLPHSGAIVFDHTQENSKGSSQPSPGQGPHCSTAPASASTSKCLDRSLDIGPIQDVDVSSMLWQIRRALGVREPCRADREARSQRQSSEVGVQELDCSTTQQTRTEEEHPLGGSFRNSHTEEAASPHNTPRTVSRSAVDGSTKTPPAQSLQVSTTAPASPYTSKVPTVKAKKKTAQMAQDQTQQWEESAEVAFDSDGRERESQGGSTAPRLGTLASLNRCMGKAVSSEPNLTAARRIRNVNESRKAEGEKEAGLKPTLQKLLSSPGSQRKVNWREMYQEMNRKKREKVKGLPRFGIELVNPLSDQEGSMQAEGEDFPLSEGFQWESAFPDDRPPTHWPLPPPPHNATDSDSLTERQSDCRMQGPSEQPGTALGDGRSIPTVAAISMKVEPNFETGDSGHFGGNQTVKNKHKADGGISNMEPSGKKRKTKSNKDQDQMDQLLAVSLREEELSHSLEDVDSSLIQARNTLQAAYTEVQRLLLLKQKFTTEVNSLRAKRIEILQGMQDGYSGASSVGEKSSTLSVGAAAGVPPRPSSLSSSTPYVTSSIQQPFATASTSSISHPHPASLGLPSMSIKQELCQLPTDERASQPAKTAAFNTAAPQMSSNQVLPVVPPVLLPTLLLTSTSASPTTVVAPPRQPRAESSTSPKTLPSSEAFIKQLEQKMREGLKDGKSKERMRLTRENSQPTESDSDCGEVTGGNLSKEHVKEDTAVRTLVPDRDQHAARDTGGGHESDHSVEMMETSSETDLEVIDIEESDNEEVPETASNVAVHTEPEKSVCVDFNTASTQTFKIKDDNAERKIQVPAVKVKDAKIPPESGDVAEDQEQFLGTFENHTGPVHGLQVHDGLLYTCSGDNTARAYSLVSRECLAVFEGHTNKVNCLLVSSPPNMLARLYTGSSDQTIRCYSMKSKKCLEQISLPDRVLCLHIAWNILYVGLANGSVVSYELKTLRQLDVLECHGPRGVSCLGTAQEGARRVLLVGSYDSTISVRDAKSGLLLRSLEGHTKTVLCMKVVNDLVFSGSSDTSVHAHNIHTGELVRIYKGHGHAVTSIAILGKVMVTACLDKLVRVYELQSHDRLQVYGGHSDMVMCMAIHKSVIYTGCYDGSVQAVKLNLMKNYRCWWQPCSLIFGMAEHLMQHLVRDHSNPRLQTAKCRWRGCNAFFASQDSIKQELPEHMRSHIKEDSKLEP